MGSKIALDRRRYNFFLVLSSSNDWYIRKMPGPEGEPRLETAEQPGAGKRGGLVTAELTQS